MERENRCKMKNKIGHAKLERQNTIIMRNAKYKIEKRKCKM